MSLKNAIVRAFDKKKKREKKDEHGNWKYPMYWAIDLHDVIIPGTYTRNNDGRCMYPHAEEVLRWLTNRKDMCIILYTSSHAEAIDDILSWINQYHIRFDYVNCNPECENNELCDFSEKMYLDIMLEDKAGFEGMSDWLIVKDTLVELGEWDKKISHVE